MKDDDSGMTALSTATRQRLDMFTSDEQGMLSDIQPLMQIIRKIMHQSGYNDGDPLSASNQAFVLDNVFSHHPDKTVKQVPALIMYRLTSTAITQVPGASKTCLDKIHSSKKKKKKIQKKFKKFKKKKKWRGLS